MASLFGQLQHNSQGLSSLLSDRDISSPEVNRLQETPELSDVAYISTPDPLQSVSPSPPSQIMKREDLSLRTRPKKRQRCDFGTSPVHKRRKMAKQGDCHDMMSTCMDDHFPRIFQNQTKMRKDTHSVLMANEQTMALMHEMLPSTNQEYHKHHGKRCLFGFEFPDFRNGTDDEDDHKVHDTDDVSESAMEIGDEIWGIEQVLDGVHSKPMSTECATLPIHRLDRCDVTIAKEDISKLQLIGDQIDRKWLVTRFKHIILLIDQHAADERVRVERLTTFIMGEEGPNGDRILSVALDEPHCISSIAEEEVDALRRNAEWIGKWGVEWNVEGDTGGSIKVYKRPSIYGTAVKGGALKGILTEIKSMTAKSLRRFIPKCIDSILNSKACRSAVKFGDALNEKQMKHLLRNLSRCKLPFQCAHGRPTMFPIANLNGFAPEKDF